MKFCEFCNKTYPDTAAYCAACGNRLVDSLRCNHCSAEVEVGYNNCPQCGKTLQKPSFATPRFERDLQPRSPAQQQRFEFFRTNLEKLLAHGRGGFVIFVNKTSGFFVQFAQDGDTLRLDHPKPHASTLFTQEHADKIKTLCEMELLEVYEGEDSIAADVGRNVNLITYLIENIFKHVFGCEDNYAITVELSLDGETIDLGN